MGQAALAGSGKTAVAPLTHQQKDGIAALWQAGWTIMRIAAQVGCNAGRVGAFVRYNRDRCPERGSGCRFNQHTGSFSDKAEPGEAVRLEARMARAAAVVSDPRALTLVDLTRSACRFPLPGSSGLAQRFCGHQTARGSYCAGHARLVYQAPMMRAAAE